MQLTESNLSVVWPDHQRKIATGYTRFQQYEEFVDMTLAADGHYVKVHQFIIALASPYLKEIIKSIPSKHPVIFLTDVSYNGLCQILEYVYTGEVHIPRQQLNDFMKSAKVLKLQGINKDADESQSNSTFGDTDMYKESKPETVIEDAAVAETMSISTELERRMSFVKDAQECVRDVNDILEEEFAEVASSHTDTQLPTQHSDYITPDVQEDYDELLQGNVINIKYIPIDLTEDGSMDQHKSIDQESQAESFFQADQSETSSPVIPTKVIKTGTISQIGQKILKVSKKAGKRKAATAIPRAKIKVKKSMTDNKTPDNQSAVQTVHAIGKSMPPPKFPVELSMPQLMSPTSEESAPSQQTIPLSEITFTGSIGGEAHSSIQVSQQQEMPQILLQMPSGATLSVIEKESAETTEASTSAQPALSTDELVNLVKSDAQESIELMDQLKEGAPQLYTLSNQGSVQIILNRFMYYPHFKAYKDHKVRWRCVDYRRQKCPAYLDTNGELIVKRVHAHTHAFHDARILAKIKHNVVYSTLCSARTGAREKAIGGATENSEDIE